MENIVRPGLVNRTFEVSDQDTSSATYNWFGFLTQDSDWVIQRFDMSVANNIAYRYATNTNNTGYATYAAAWTARATLQYDYFDVVKV